MDFENKGNCCQTIKRKMQKMLCNIIETKMQYAVKDSFCFLTFDKILKSILILYQWCIMKGILHKFCKISGNNILINETLSFKNLKFSLINEILVIKVL